MTGKRYDEIEAVYNSYAKKYGKHHAPEVWTLADLDANGRMFDEEDIDYQMDEDKIRQQRVTNFLKETKISPEEIGDWAYEVMEREGIAFNAEFERARDERAAQLEQEYQELD